MAPLGFVPQVGMIVWCRVPEQRSPVKFPPPGPKSRPAFIQSIYQGANGEPDYLVVVPGTSQATKSGAIYPWDFTFQQGDPGFSGSGLLEDTRFKTNMIVAVPLTADYFDECAPQTLVGQQSVSASMGMATGIQAKIEGAFKEWRKEIERRKRANQ